MLHWRWMGERQRYGQFCPVAKGAEIVARPWTPLVLRELMCGSTRFNDLRRGVPRMSPSLLSSRLDELEEAGVIRREETDGQAVHYRLTEAGEELRPVIEALGTWGKRWTKSRLDEADLDVALLMWDVRRRIETDSLPDERVVARFAFPLQPEEKLRLWWLVLDRPEVDLCLEDPGHDVDLWIETDVRTLTGVWLGDRSWGEALRSGALEVVGPTELRRSFPDWLGLSLFAPVERRGEPVDAGSDAG